MIFFKEYGNCALKPCNGHVLCAVVLSLRICLFSEDISPTSMARVFVTKHTDDNTWWQTAQECSTKSIMAYPYNRVFGIQNNDEKQKHHKV